MRKKKETRKAKRQKDKLKMYEERSGYFIFTTFDGMWIFFLGEEDKGTGSIEIRQKKINNLRRMLFIFTLLVA